MLKRLKISLFGSGHSAAVPAQPSAVTPPSATLPGGFQPVQDTDALLNSEHRRRCLQQTAQTISMPAALYGTLCSQPLGALLHRVQQVPAAAHGSWARQGGFGDLTLQYTACAVRLAKGAMFPPGAAPEEQSAQSAVWNAVVFWAALFHHLPLLTRMEGEQLNGEPWLPGMTVPEKAWRCRFRKNEPAGADASAVASLMAAQLLPAEAVKWLAGTPAALHNLAGALWNGHPEMPLIRDILRQAAEKVDAPSMATGTLSSPAASLPTVSPPVPTPAVIPAAADTPPLPDAVAAAPVEILLSELVSPIAADPALTSPATDEVSGGPVMEEGVSAAMPTPADDAPDSSGETDMLLPLFSVVAEDAEPTPAPVDKPGDSAGPEQNTVPVDAILLSVLPHAEPPDDGPVSDDGNPEVPVPQISTAPELSGASSQADIHVATEEAVSAVGRANHSRPDMQGGSNATGGLPDGEAFLAWLIDALRSGQLPVNGLQDRVHIVAGHVFLPVPGIFFEYMKQTDREVTERGQIQREFEQLNICKRRDNKRYWFAHQQQDEQGQAGYKKRKGYLIKGRQLFGRVPQDSPYLSFP